MKKRIKIPDVLFYPTTQLHFDIDKSAITDAFEVGIRNDTSLVELWKGDTLYERISVPKEYIDYETDNFSGFKIKVTPEESERVQRILFQHEGFAWNYDAQGGIRYTNEPYIFVDENKVLSYGIYDEVFINSKLPELTMQDVVNKFGKLLDEDTTDWQKGDLKDFPIEVIKAMLDEQEKQTGKRDVSVFQQNKSEHKLGGGFSWLESVKELKLKDNFWSDVINRKDFDLFFDTFYPSIKIDEKVAIKENDGKVSYTEIDPNYIALMAKRMSGNKGKYPIDNWKKEIDVLELLDSIERHTADLKLLLKGEQPIHNKDEKIQDHLAALGCNAMMINYQIK